MDREKKELIMKTILIIDINRQGIAPLNSSRLDRQLAGKLNQPEFGGLGVTLQDLKDLYADLVKDALVSLQNRY